MWSTSGFFYIDENSPTTQKTIYLEAMKQYISTESESDLLPSKFSHTRNFTWYVGA